MDNLSFIMSNISFIMSKTLYNGNGQSFFYNE